MNKDNDEFEIIRDEDGVLIIEGLINTSPVSNERDVLEKLMLICSIIGLTDTKEQLYYDETKSGDDVYIFRQCYGGIKLYSSCVYVCTDENSQLY